jgi:hypothetical protein
LCPNDTHCAREAGGEWGSAIVSSIDPLPVSGARKRCDAITSFALDRRSGFISFRETLGEFLP